MRQRIEKKEIRPSQPSVTVMFHDRTVVLGRLDSFRLGWGAASSLSATATVWAKNVPAQPSFSVRLTETLETSDSFRNLASLYLIQAHVGDDIISASQSNDRIDGGAGHDTVTYTGSQAGYTLTLTPTSTSLKDRRIDGLGTDELIDFETDLMGKPSDLIQFGGTKGLSDGTKGAEVMALFDGTEDSIQQAITKSDEFYQDALDPTNGEFLLQVVGVLDDPFAIA